jgi:hypothetical protein
MLESFRVPSAAANRVPVADGRATIAMTDFGNGFYGLGVFNQSNDNNHR